MAQKKLARTKLKPRKAPTQTRSQETVEAIVEAAAHVLDKHGLEGYTTNAIAERAGVSIGSLYQYFPNKDALTMALLEIESAKLLADIQAVDLATGVDDALREMLEAAVEHQLGRPNLARLLDIEEMRFPPSAALLDSKQKMLTVMVSLFRQEGYEFVESAEQIAEDILVIARGINDAAGERQEKDRDALLKRLMRAVTGFIYMSRKRPG